MAGVAMNDGVGVALVVLLVSVAVLIVVALVVAIRTMEALRRNIEDLRQSPLSPGDRPSWGDQYVVFRHSGPHPTAPCPEALVGATPALGRADDPLWSDRPLTAGVEAASRLAYLTFSSPVIKTLALGSGTLRAVRAFRRD